jgi:glycosyltransferase involved in cell wall biosynthesis
MPLPTVTFVVPCYGLAHYLRECVESIVAQTHRDLEILVLDDRSPDDTAAVSRALVAAHPDREITYVQNPENLGNIRNYNKGIGLARGRYVWILSPDDRLRSPHVVERYVALMEARADVGFCFCAANRIEGDRDTGVYERSRCRAGDAVLEPGELVPELVENRFELTAPTVMIRKACYEQISMFPPEMPHRGDTILWAAIALRTRVAYFAEPMVDYRVHAGSMHSTLAREKILTIMRDDLAIPWRVKADAEALGRADLVEYCWNKVISAYRDAIVGVTCRGGSLYVLPAEGVEPSVAEWEPDPAVRARLRRILARWLYWTSLAQLVKGRPANARRALRGWWALDPRLCYRPPLAELRRRAVRTRDLRPAVPA